MKGCKTIAEYSIRKWMETKDFVPEMFSVEMSQNVGTITDKTGASMKVEYVPETKEVIEI